MTNPANLSGFQQEYKHGIPSKPVKPNRRRKPVRAPPRLDAKPLTTFEHCQVFSTPLGLMIVEASA